MANSFHKVRKNSMNPNTMKPGEGRSRIESFSNAMKISSDAVSNLSNEEDLMKFKRFQQDFKYINAAHLQISMKNILLPILGTKKAFVYALDSDQDFYKTITRHEDKLWCQHLYFDYYSRISPSLIS